MNMEFSQHSTMIMKRYWKEFLMYCYNQDIKYYDLKYVHLFLKDKYFCKLINNKCELTKEQKNAAKSMNILVDINCINTFIKIKEKNIELNDYYLDLLNNYLDFWKNIKNNSDETIQDKKSETIKLFRYLIENNISHIRDFNKNEILKFLDINKNKTRSQRISINWNLRSLFIFLDDSEILKNNYEKILPVIKRIKERKLPATFEKDDVEKIINYLKDNVDSTSAGYRNYAMFLIAARLGLRKIDIINLKWNNIDWENNLIKLTQMKTKINITLPLFSDVGNAIINYIKKERPFKIKSNDDYIFIRHRYPLIKLSNQDSMTEIINKIFIHLNIPINKYKQKGLHSFRFTLATELLNENVPSHIISSVLGHNNPNSTKAYLRVNDVKLSECFVEDEYE